MRGRYRSGSPAQAASGSTTWPSASTIGPARGGSGGSPARRHVRRAAPIVDQREPVAEEAAGVAAGHRPQLVVGQRAPGRRQHGLRVGPRRVGVRVVALHHDVVEADHVALRHGGRVVDGAEPEVAPEDLARQEVRRPGGALGARGRMAQDVVGPVHQHRDPPDAALGQRHLQAREAQGDARPEPFAGGQERVHGEHGGQQLERRVGGGQGGPRRRAGVQADDGLRLLAGGEEGIPGAAEDGGQLQLRGELREADRLESPGGVGPHLGRRHRHVGQPGQLQAG